MGSPYQRLFCRDAVPKAASCVSVVPCKAERRPVVARALQLRLFSDRRQLAPPVAERRRFRCRRGVGRSPDAPSLGQFSSARPSPSSSECLSKKTDADGFGCCLRSRAPPARGLVVLFFTRDLAPAWWSLLSAFDPQLPGGRAPPLSLPQALDRPGKPEPGAQPRLWPAMSGLPGPGQRPVRCGRSRRPR